MGVDETEDITVEIQQLVNLFQAEQLINTSTWSQGEYSELELDNWRSFLTPRDCAVLGEVLGDRQKQIAIKNDAEDQIYQIAKEYGYRDAAKAHFTRRAHNASSQDDKEYILELRDKDLQLTRSLSRLLREDEGLQYEKDIHLSLARNQFNKYVDASEQQYKNNLLLAQLKSRAESEEQEDQTTEE
jgi:hypothetical protein